jgi:hypothetical protein
MWNAQGSRNKGNPRNSWRRSTLTKLIKGAGDLLPETGENGRNS